MIHDPTDIFDQMEEMFDRLIAGAGQQRFPAAGHRVRNRSEIRNPYEEEMAEEVTGRKIRTAFEPAADVQLMGNEVKVVAELPGITSDSLRLGVRDGRLIIDAGDADQHYHTTATLPPVDAASMRYTLKNGVLDVTFTADGNSRQPAGTGKS
jgi:HSP20 family molecular chaperone IbpA